MADPAITPYVGASANDVALRYMFEAAFNTLPGANPDMTEIVCRSESLSRNNQVVQSDTIRSDRMREASIQTGYEVAGDMNVELVAPYYLDFFKALLGNLWVAISCTGVSVTAATSDDSFTAASGSFFTNVVPGMYVKVAGMAAANNGVHRVLTKESADKITVATNLTDETVGSGATIKANMIRNGVLAYSFLVEKMAAAGEYFWLPGLRCTGFSANLPKKSKIDATFNFMGVDQQESDTSILGTGTLTQQTPATAMNTSNNVAWLRKDNSAISCYIEAMTLAIQTGAHRQDAFMSEGSVGIADGSFDISGTINTYFSDRAHLYQNVLDRDDIALALRLTDVDGADLIFTFPACKITGNTPQATGINQDVFFNGQFTAHRDATTDCMVQIDYMAA